MTATPDASVTGEPASCGVTHNLAVNMEQARDQVDQVTNIMRGNVDKIMEREGKLQDLENKAEQLQADSQQFQVRRGGEEVERNLSLTGIIIYRKQSSKSRGKPGWKI